MNSLHLLSILWCYWTFVCLDYKEFSKVELQPNEAEFGEFGDVGPPTSAFFLSRTYICFPGF